MRRNSGFEQYFFVGIVLVAFGIVILPFWKALVLGGLLAMLVHPAFEWGCRNRIPPTLWALVLSGLLVVGAVLPLTTVLFVLGRDAAQLATKLTDSGALLQWVEGPVLPFLESWVLRLESFLHISQAEVLGLVKQSLSVGGSALLQWVGSLATRVPSLIIDFVVFLLALFFSMLQGKKWIEVAYKILPFDSDDEAIFFKTVEGITRGVVWGSIVVGLVQGTLMTLAFAWTDLPRPLLFGCLTFLCSFIPFVGSGPVGIGALILLAARSDWSGFLIVGVFFAVASLSDNFLRPWILKGSAELHPLLAFVCVLGGLATFGFAGLFLGPIFAALGVATIRMLERRDVSSA